MQGGAEITIERSTIQGGAGAMSIEDGGEVTAQGSTFRGRVSKRPEGKLTDNGGNYHVGDFTWTFWGYGERVFNPGTTSPDFWRRFRQGSELDFPRITPGLRPAFVYEFDLADSNFLANGVGHRRGLGRRRDRAARAHLTRPQQIWEG